ncbi:MAG: FAD-dependent oxidoreductase, partial [Hyphomicrobiales bacterium]
EQNLAQTKGARIKHNVQPVRIMTTDEGAVCGIELEYTATENGTLSGTGETFVLEADMVFKAIGQTFDVEGVEGSITLEQGRIKVNEARQTTLDKVWAGGDCVAGGDDLTVSAVQDGKLAAEAIHAKLNA